jgi:hypothetical protein
MGVLSNHARVLVPITVVTLLIGFATGVLSANVQAPTITVVNQLALYDANGKRIGTPYALGDTSASVAVKIGTYLVSLTFTREAFHESSSVVGTPLLFETTDCTGQAYDAHSAIDLVRPNLWFSVVVMNGQKLYSISGEPREINYQSMLNELDGTTCEANVGTNVQTPVQFLADLRSTFEAPFTIR